MQPNAQARLASMTVRAQALLLRSLALILLVLAVPLCLVALGAAAGLLALPHPLWLVEQRLPVLFPMHMASAGLALVALPMAIWCHGFSLHRLVGRTAAALALTGGATALPVALASEAHWLARAGFLVQALAWVALALAGVRAIRRGERARHMWLMLAVTAIASGAVWLRLATWLAVRWSERFDFHAVYALGAWLSWMMPLAGVALLARCALGPLRRSRLVLGVNRRDRRPWPSAPPSAGSAPRPSARSG